MDGRGVSISISLGFKGLFLYTVGYCWCLLVLYMEWCIRQLCSSSIMSFNILASHITITLISPLSNIHIYILICSYFVLLTVKYMLAK